MKGFRAESAGVGRGSPDSVGGALGPGVEKVSTGPRREGGAPPGLSTAVCLCRMRGPWRPGLASSLRASHTTSTYRWASQEVSVTLVGDSMGDTLSSGAGLYPPCPAPGWGAGSGLLLLSPQTYRLGAHSYTPG